ncbi:MAG TPA: hypothetical protein VF421_00795 [Niabella sp.]
MIIFGTRGKVLKTNAAPLDCGHCGTKSAVYLRFVVRYFHIFWIPIFPTSKKGVTQCTHCKEVLYENQLPAGLRATYYTEKQKVRTPLQYYTGLLLVGVFALFVMYTGYTSSKNNRLFIKDPRVGDVYEVKESSNKFTLYKVTGVTADSVEVVSNTYFADRSSALYKLRRKHGTDYGSEKSAFSRSRLQALFDEKQILNVKRE